MATLIIAEKPSVARRIAFSLPNEKIERLRKYNVSYYKLIIKNEEYYVASAVGHIFTIAQKGNEKSYPIFEVCWKPSYEVSKEAYFTKNYFFVLNEIAKKCNKFINACDYDIEGSVIGTNIIRFLGDLKNSYRMKFSTLTKEELVESFENLLPLDINNFYAGEARHILDWIWGINLSRALMEALKKAGRRKILSIGRIQGPTLALVAEREKEIESFIPKPYWRIFANANGINFESIKGKIFEREEAEETLKNCKEEGIVERIERRKISIRAPPPFDLTTLQIEAYRIFKIPPSKTLAIAQSLYEKALISYPRTSSQKLPRKLNLPSIIKKLKNSSFGKFATELIEKSLFTPKEGKKEDEAHPAIYPTGVIPKALKKEESLIYELIVKRFLACFYENEEFEEIKAYAKFGKEEFLASGKVEKKKTWTKVYDYYSFEENKKIESLKEGDKLIAKIEIKEEKTKPPARYTRASLVKKLEELNLGTKATRAEIVDTLFERGYVEGEKIRITSLGKKVYETLKLYSKEILDEKLTRDMEIELEMIQKEKEKEENVIGKWKKVLEEILKKFREKEKEIGKELYETTLKEEEEKRKKNILGKCKCGGELIIIKTKKGRFVGCSNYPKCKEVYPLPKKGIIVATNKVCKYCGSPIIKVFLGKGKVYEMCINPKCKSRELFIKEKKENK
ncbi:MAG: DNA topoisomerase I [Candidatus Micrarchaeales archaeon]